MVSKQHAVLEDAVLDVERSPNISPEKSGM
jgi:hypothetical protein